MLKLFRLNIVSCLSFTSIIASNPTPQPTRSSFPSFLHAHVHARQLPPSPCKPSHTAPRPSRFLQLHRTNQPSHSASTCAQQLLPDHPLLHTSGSPTPAVSWPVLAATRGHPLPVIRDSAPAATAMHPCCHYHGPYTSSPVSHAAAHITAMHPCC